MLNIREEPEKVYWTIKELADENEITPFNIRDIVIIFHIKAKPKSKHVKDKFGRRPSALISFICTWKYEIGYTNKKCMAMLKAFVSRNSSYQLHVDWKKLKYENTHPF